MEVTSRPLRNNFQNDYQETEFKTGHILDWHFLSLRIDSVCVCGGVKNTALS